MKGDAICKSWKRQAGSIKLNKVTDCSVAREDLASFLSLFDIVIIGDNEYRKWSVDAGCVACFKKSFEFSFSGQVGGQDKVHAECDGRAVGKSV